MAKTEFDHILNRVEHAWKAALGKHDYVTLELRDVEAMLVICKGELAGRRNHEDWRSGR